MKDKNGIELKAGDIVKIEGGFFKSDNGLWVVTQDGTNPGYARKDDEVTLHKISKSGKLKASKGTGFYPIMVTTNSWIKRKEAKAWNAAHATIEKVEGINNQEVVALFEKALKDNRESLSYYEKCGYCEKFLEPYRGQANYYERALARMTA